MSLYCDVPTMLYLSISLDVLHTYRLCLTSQFTSRSHECVLAVANWKWSWCWHNIYWTVCRRWIWSESHSKTRGMYNVLNLANGIFGQRCRDRLFLCIGDIKSQWWMNDEQRLQSSMLLVHQLLIFSNEWNFAYGIWLMVIIQSSNIIIKLELPLPVLNFFLNLANKPFFHHSGVMTAMFSRHLWSRARRRQWGSPLGNIIPIFRHQAISVSAEMCLWLSKCPYCLDSMVQSGVDY